MKKGFTLIELLVVIAIIGSLSALFVPNFMSARERSRDTERKSDLKQIQKAFELFRQDQNPPSYPDVFPTANECFASGGADCSGTVYMNQFPTDPLPDNQYFYDVDNANLTYIICACIENQADAESTASCTTCGTCSSGKCYNVTQP